MLTQDELALAIRVLGGARAASRLLGYSDTLIRHWLARRRFLTAQKAQRLRELVIEVSGTLPTVAYNLKLAAQEAEMRLALWRARRPRWEPARGDKPRLSRLERGERQWRNRQIAARVTAGEPIAALAREYNAQPRTIARWAHRGGR